MEINLSVCTSRELGGNSVNLVSGGRHAFVMKGLGPTDGMLPERVHA